MIITDNQRLQWLSSETCEQIHDASCLLLSTVGVKVTNEKIAGILIHRGARLEGDRIVLPQDIVESALSESARIIRFDAPNPSRGFIVDSSENQVFFGTGGQALNVVHRTDNGWVSKPAVSKDLKQILILCDRLAHVDFVTRPVECDVPEDRMDIEKAKLFKAHCSKPMNLANLINAARLDDIIAMIGEPSYLSFIVCLVASPLTMDSAAGDKLIALVEHDLPVAISSCPQGGCTAPFSEVGELIQLNAELLFGFVVANSINPGAKILYRGIPVTADLEHDGSPRWCQPESIRRMALAAQLCRYYNLPCCGTAGVSDEAVPSAQGITEKVMSWMYEAASGAHYINSALGMLQQVMSVSPYQYVIDNIVLEQVKRQMTSHHDCDIGSMAVHLSLEALSHFGVETDEQMEDELYKRVGHIETGLEPWDREYIMKQANAAAKAVAKKGGSNLFMTGARKGLREGYLYTGKKIDAAIDLSAVREHLFADIPDGELSYE